jgi:hypothetical protein
MVKESFELRGLARDRRFSQKSNFSLLHSISFRGRRHFLGVCQQPNSETRVPPRQVVRAYHAARPRSPRLRSPAALAANPAVPAHYAFSTPGSKYLPAWPSMADNWASASTWMSSECKHSDVSVARLAWQETLS